MKTKNVIFVLVLFTLILSACQSAPPATENVEEKPTKTPLPTDTPIPTNTPLPTETPIPTNTPLPAGMIFMDDFQGEKGAELWKDFTESPNEIIRENGILSVKLTSTEVRAPLMAAQDIFNLDLYGNGKVFYEADLLLHNFKLPETSGKVIRSGISISLSLGDWNTECGVVGTTYIPEPYIGCYSTDGFSTNYPVGELDSWQKFRIEVDPSSMVITYFLNNDKIGEYTPPQEINFDTYPFAFKVKASIDGGSEGELFGEIDNVQIGTFTE